MELLALMQNCRNTGNQSCSNMLHYYRQDILSSNYKAYRDDYRWEPVCTRDGKFDPKQCIGPRDKPRWEWLKEKRKQKEALTADT